MRANDCKLTMNLNKGYGNWVCFPVASDNGDGTYSKMTVQDVLEAVETATSVNVTQIQDPTAGKASQKIGDIWVGSLEEIDPQYGYFIWLDGSGAAADFDVIFYNAVFTTQINQGWNGFIGSDSRYNIHNGWTLISYPWATEESWANCWGDPDGLYFDKVITAGIAAATLTNGTWVGSQVSANFKPGQCYWVHNKTGAPFNLFEVFKSPNAGSTTSGGKTYEELIVNTGADYSTWMNIDVTTSSHWLNFAFNEDLTYHSNSGGTPAGPSYGIELFDGMPCGKGSKLFAVASADDSIIVGAQMGLFNQHAGINTTPSNTDAISHVNSLRKKASGTIVSGVARSGAADGEQQINSLMHRAGSDDARYYMPDDRLAYDGYNADHPVFGPYAVIQMVESAFHLNDITTMTYNLRLWESRTRRFYDLDTRKSDGSNDSTAHTDASAGTYATFGTGGAPLVVRATCAGFTD